MSYVKEESQLEVKLLQQPVAGRFKGRQIAMRQDIAGAYEQYGCQVYGNLGDGITGPENIDYCSRVVLAVCMGTRIFVSFERNASQA